MQTSVYYIHCSLNLWILSDQRYGGTLTSMPRRKTSEGQECVSFSRCCRYFAAPTPEEAATSVYH